MKEFKTRMKKGEFWYGGHTNHGFLMPIGRGRVFSVDTRLINSCGQANTLFISNMGRVICSEEGFLTKFVFGKITCKSNLSDILYLEAEDKTLRGAFKMAVKEFMPPDGKYPDELMFRVPQYCTWIQLDNNQNQKGILEYAKSIISCNMPAGELIIDDGWQITFGEWDFREEAFSDAKAMIKELKELGFKVILWIAPFVSSKAKDYNFLLDNDLLVKDKTGKVASRKWWNGEDTLLDFSNPKAQEWFFRVTDKLIDEFGVDGFKQDAGDAHYYCDDDITYGNVGANTQSMLWAKSSVRYRFNELRACFKCGGMGVAQRLADKSHKWNFSGLGALIPNALIQGLSGYPYTCPDMIGGGVMGDFRNVDQKNLDHELFARYCQTSALMPMMQYSLGIWNLGNEMTKKICKEMTTLHMEYGDYIMKYARLASVTGEPIVRFMEYNFPHNKYGKLKTQFALGEDIIVAPVLIKGESVKKVCVPDGKWSYKGKIYEKGMYKISCAIDELIVLRKC